MIFSCLIKYFSADYDALRALDADIVPDAMTQEQIDALPLYVFGVEPRPTFGYVVNRLVLLVTKGNTDELNLQPFSCTFHLD